MQVALDEVLTNILRRLADGTAHRVDIALAIEGDAHGGARGRLRAFDPLSVPPPELSASLQDRRIGGLGVHFVRRLMSDVSLRRIGTRNRLVLTKRLEERKGRNRWKCMKNSGWRHRPGGEGTPRQHDGTGSGRRLRRLDAPEAASCDFGDLEYLSSAGFRVVARREARRRGRRAASCCADLRRTCASSSTSADSSTCSPSRPRARKRQSRKLRHECMPLARAVCEKPSPRTSFTESVTRPPLAVTC